MRILPLKDSADNVSNDVLKKAKRIVSNNNDNKNKNKNNFKS